MKRRILLTFALSVFMLLGTTETSNAQWGSFVKKAIKNVASSKPSSSSNSKASSNLVASASKSKANSSSNSKSVKSSKSRDSYVTKNKLNSRRAKNASKLTMVKEQKTVNDVSYEELRFYANDNLVFKLIDRRAIDNLNRTKEGVFSSEFVKEGEAVYHSDELQEVIDINGKSHSIFPQPSLTKRVLKTPDNVFMIYNFNDGKKAGTKYPYYAARKSEFFGPHIIAAPSEAKFDEWNGQKALDYVKDFEKRVKLGSFKFVPRKGKLHTDALATKCKQAILKKMKQYTSNANMQIKKIVVYSDAWDEQTDNVTDEVTSRQLTAYYLFVNGDESNLHCAKITQKFNGSSFSNVLEVEKNYSDKFSKKLPASLVNKLFK